MNASPKKYIYQILVGHKYPVVQEKPIVGPNSYSVFEPTPIGPVHSVTFENVLFADAVRESQLWYLARVTFRCKTRDPRFFESAKFGSILSACLSSFQIRLEILGFAWYDIENNQLESGPSPSCLPFSENTRIGHFGPHQFKRVPASDTKIGVLALNYYTANQLYLPALEYAVLFAAFDQYAKESFDPNDGVRKRCNKLAQSLSIPDATFDAMYTLRNEVMHGEKDVKDAADMNQLGTLRAAVWALLWCETERGNSDLSGTFQVLNVVRNTYTHNNLLEKPFERWTWDEPAQIVNPDREQLVAKDVWATDPTDPIIRRSIRESLDKI